MHSRVSAATTDTSLSSSRKPNTKLPTVWGNKPQKRNHPIWKKQDGLSSSFYVFLKPWTRPLEENMLVSNPLLLRSKEVAWAWKRLLPHGCFVFNASRSTAPASRFSPSLTEPVQDLCLSGSPRATISSARRRTDCRSELGDFREEIVPYTTNPFLDVFRRWGLVEEPGFFSRVRAKPGSMWISNTGCRPDRCFSRPC